MTVQTTRTTTHSSDTKPMAYVLLPGPAADSPPLLSIYCYPYSISSTHLLLPVPHHYCPYVTAHYHRSAQVQLIPNSSSAHLLLRLLHHSAPVTLSIHRYYRSDLMPHGPQPMYHSPQPMHCCPQPMYCRCTAAISVTRLHSEIRLHSVSEQPNPLHAKRIPK